MRALRQHGAMLRQLARRVGRDVASFSRTAPACGFSSPASTRSSVDLPAPFGPTSATTSPGATASDTPSSSVFAPARTVMPLAAMTRHPASALCRSSSERKNGAPIAAVTMPIGSSAGAAMMRAKVSAASSRIAPRHTAPAAAADGPAR